MTETFPADLKASNYILLVLCSCYRACYRSYNHVGHSTLMVFLTPKCHKPLYKQLLKCNVIKLYGSMPAHKIIALHRL